MKKDTLDKKRKVVYNKMVGQNKGYGKVEN